MLILVLLYPKVRDCRHTCGCHFFCKLLFCSFLLPNLYLPFPVSVPFRPGLLLFNCSSATCLPSTGRFVAHSSVCFIALFIIILLDFASCWHVLPSFQLISHCLAHICALFQSALLLWCHSMLCSIPVQFRCFNCPLHVLCACSFAFVMWYVPCCIWLRLWQLIMCLSVRRKSNGSWPRPYVSVAASC